MNEKIPRNNGDKTDIQFLRHTKAGYKSYEKILASHDPEQAIDLENQVLPDIDEAGIQFAEQEAEKLFAQMSTKDALFFVSSSQARTLETAQIYKNVARQMGFTIITPEHHRNPLAERMDESDIRVINALSLRPSNSLWGAVYNPPSQLPEINWEPIDRETKNKWFEARKIVLASEKGNWGSNFAHFSNTLHEKGLLPEEETSVTELFQTQFPQLLKLVRFAANKAKGGYNGKKIQIIAVGHENYLAKAFEEYFGEEGIKNCEVVSIEVDKSGINMTRRGTTKTIGKYETKKPHSSSREEEVNHPEEFMTEEERHLVSRRLESRGFAPENFNIAGYPTSKKPISEIEKFSYMDLINQMSNEDLQYIYNIIHRDSGHHLKLFGAYTRFEFIWKLVWDEGLKRGIFTEKTHDSSKPDMEF